MILLLLFDSTMYYIVTVSTCHTVKYFLCPNFEKVGDILVSACLCVCLCVCVCVCVRVWGIEISS